MRSRSDSAMSEALHDDIEACGYFPNLVEDTIRIAVADEPVTLSIQLENEGTVDLDRASFSDASGTAVWEDQWIYGDGSDRAMHPGDTTTFTQTLRQTLPQGQFILTHAPLAPWLSPNQQFAAGAYLTVNKNVGQLIDWVRVLH